MKISGEDLRPLAGGLAALCALGVLAGIGRPPGLDEESYLWIGAEIARSGGWPYGWSRDWPPWDGDAFVYAHPPLFLWWVALWQGAGHAIWGEGGAPLPLLRLCVGLPWALLLGAAAGGLIGRTTRHPWNAAALWITAPVVLLSLQYALMIDLPVVALGAAAVACWREGFAAERPRWFAAAGLCLGLACLTKYPAAALLPVLAIHGWRRAQFQSAPVARAAQAGLVLAAAIWAAGEIGLWSFEGRWHLAEVWARRGEIPAGPLLPRAFGALIRMGLLALPLVFVRTGAIWLGLGAIPAVALLAATRPALPGQGSGLLLISMATTGGALLARAAGAALSPYSRRRKGDRDDGLLLGGWLLASVASVIFLHNFASARYLLPAALPAAILVARSAEEFSHGKRIAQATAGLQLALGLALCVADARAVRAGVEVAEGVLATAAEAGVTAGRFEGEWSFRWRLEQAGWRHRRPGETLPPGTWLAVSQVSAMTVGDRAGMRPLRAVDAEDRFPLRVADPQAGIGLHAETLGVFPLGIGRGPLEEALIFVVQPDSAATPAAPEPP